MAPGLSDGRRLSRRQSLDRPIGHRPCLIQRAGFELEATRVDLSRDFSLADLQSAEPEFELTGVGPP